jgi:hypothetical protein
MKLNDMVTSDLRLLSADASVSAVARAEVDVASSDAMANPVEAPCPDMTCIGPRKKNNGDLLGWRVNVARRGVHVDRLFSPHRYGTSDKALQAAMAFRDDVLAQLKLLSMAEYCTIVKSHNTSGIPGVRRTKEGAWRMRIKLPDGREVGRLFSVSRHGEQGAFELAVQARAQALASVQDYPVHHGGKKQPVRDQPISVLGAYELSRPTYVEAPDPNPYYKERTNVPGVVNFSIPYVRTNGEKTIKHYKLARYKAAGQKLKQRYFSVQEHGEEAALGLAIEQRKVWALESLDRPSDNQLSALHRIQMPAESPVLRLRNNET